MSSRLSVPWYRALCALLVLSLALAPGFAEKEKPTPASMDGAKVDSSKPSLDGALDPNLPGRQGSGAPRAYEKVLLDAVVGPNVLAHDRTLCPNGRGLQQNETSITVAGDVVLVAFNDARGAYCRDEHAAVGWGYSLDGGATFTDGGGMPFSPNLNNGDPWVGASPDGQTFYLSGLWNGFGGFGFYRGRVEGDSFVWDDPVVIAYPPQRMDKEAFAVDPNNGIIYLTYTDLGRGIKLTRSTDGGLTWLAEPTVVYDRTAQGSFPALDSNGTLYVASNFADQIVVSRSRDRGDTFDQLITVPFRRRVVPSMDRSPSFPQVAVDRSGGPREGWVYVVWQQLDPDEVLSPYIMHSSDSGETWSDPVAMHTDDTGADHWWPSVSVDDNGNVNAIFFDRRLNPGTALTDTFFAQSTDGGQTFTNVRVTDTSGDWSDISYERGFTYAGDYIRAVSYGTNVYATWADVRNGDPDIYFSRIDAGQMALRHKK